MIDRYDNALSTQSAKARENYVIGVDRVLAGEYDMVGAFETALAHDPDFALAHIGLARAQQLAADVPAAHASVARARDLAANASVREAAHINALALMLEGKVKQAYPAIREHVDDYPRDALVAQTATSVFGLIGFSGQPGREAELLAYTSALVPHYGDDWWMQSQHAFSLCETGQIDQASQLIDRSLARQPRSAHSAHIRAHIDYENGDVGAGAKYLAGWLDGYNKRGLMHGHISWHVALWSLEQGDTDAMWDRVDADVKPGAALGLPINVLTDSASILYRAELAGEHVSTDRWKSVSDFASKFFPKPSVGFADVHAGLAHAMAGNSEALETIIANSAGPAADLVREYSSAYRAIAAQNWAEATATLVASMGDHARIGGSRAQRDLLLYTLIGTLLKQDRQDEACRLLALNRPAQAGTHPVKGL